VISQDGEIAHRVEEEDKAWHASGCNTDSIGIEHVGYGDEPTSTTNVEHEVSARLVRWLCHEYGIERSRTSILGHYECPGGNPGCPGVAWNWDYYMNLIRDDAAPTVQITNTTTDGSSVSVYWIGDDSGYPGAGIDRYECWIDSGSPVVGTANEATFHGLSEGTHTAHVRALDKVLNISDSDMNFVIDTIAPVTTLSVDPPDGLNGWYITAPAILLWPNETATIYYHWDSQPDEVYTAGALTAPEGINKLYFHAVDQAGNVENEQQHEFKVDTHTETSSLSISPSSPDGNFFWYRTVPTITLSATGGASIYYHWNFEPDVPYASPFMAPEGSNWLYFHCEDQAGNIESSNIEFIEVDSVSPSVVIDSVATSQDQATVYWSGTDGTSGIDYYEVKLDGGAWIYTGASPRVI